mmetsp:Transcript_37369/g.116194  ORF Transcript_37369/g.116194 Transcript_37369/m.116194 type:complete len:210 (-) Transcript_37369:88-717(-)
MSCKAWLMEPGWPTILPGLCPSKTSGSTETFAPVLSCNSWRFSPPAPINLSMIRAGRATWKVRWPGSFPNSGESGSRSRPATSTKFATMLSKARTTWSCSSPCKTAMRKGGAGKVSSRLLTQTLQPVSPSMTARVLPLFPMMFAARGSVQSSLKANCLTTPRPAALDQRLPLPPPLASPPPPSLGSPRCPLPGGLTPSPPKVPRSSSLA